jgi:thioredoxin 1
MKILKFYADWCVPCKALSATLETMTNLPEIQEINVDVQPELMQKYGIRSVPTMIRISDDGQEVSRKSGNLKKEEILDFFD